MHCRTTLILFILCLTAPAARAQDSCRVFPQGAPHREYSPAAADVTHARINAEIFPEEQALAGSIRYDLALDRRIDSVLIVDMDVELDSIFAMVGDSARVPVVFRPAGPDSSYVDLTRLSDAGMQFDSTLHLTITFRGRAARFGDRAAWFAGTAQPWFPWNGDPADRFPAEITLTVPETWSAAAPGVPTTQPSASGGTRTFGFVTPQQLPARQYGFLAGDFDQSIAFAALPAGRQVAVQRFGRPAPEQTAEIVEFVSDWTGFSYPFASYHELVGADLQAAGSAQLATRPAGFDAPASRTRDDLTAFAAALPVARQWFGAIVSGRSWSDYWIEESFPAFLAAEYAFARGDERIFQELRDAYFEQARSYQRPLVWDRFHFPGELSDLHARAKGAWVLRMLRARTGDEAFREGIRQLFDDRAFTSISTESLLDAIASKTDYDVHRFAETWLLAAGHPVLHVEYAEAGDGITLRVDQQQEGDRIPEAFRIETAVLVGTLEGEERFELVIDERQEELTLPVSAPPRYLVIDPDGHTLMEQTVVQPASAWVAQLRDASSIRARVLAAEALEAAGDDPALLLGLRAAYESEPNERVRAAILKAMAAHAPSAAAERVLVGAFADSSTVVRIAALEGLAAFPDSAAAKSFAARAAQEAGRPFLQAQAVRTLAELRAPQAVDVARSALITPSPGDVIRAAGLDALALLHPLAPGAAFEASVEYSGPGYVLRVRRAAIRLLSALAAVNRNAQDRLVELLSSSRPEIRLTAARALFDAGRLDELLEEQASPDLHSDVSAFIRSRRGCL